MTTSSTADALRLHLASAHALGNALDLDDDEAAQAHSDEHDGPCTIRNHDRADLSYDLRKVGRVLAEARKMDGPTVPPRSFASRAEAAAHARVAEFVRQIRPLRSEGSDEIYSISTDRATGARAPLLRSDLEELLATADRIADALLACRACGQPHARRDTDGHPTWTGTDGHIYDPAPLDRDAVLRATGRQA